MAIINILTSLARAKNWAGVSTTNDDTLITELLGEVSRFILSYLGRPTLFDNYYLDVMDGLNQTSVILRQWPVTEVSLLTVNDSVITPAPNSTASGFVLEPWDGIGSGAPQRLSLRGHSYVRGVGNVTIGYHAGYKISNEAWIVPSSGGYTVTVNAPLGSFGADAGVTYASGTALTLVGAAPALGQYAVSAGVYTFAAADAGASVFISYSFIPSDIENACVALVAERYRYRSRIGEVAKTLGGQETVSFYQKDMPEFVRTLLQPYRRVLPLY